LEQAKDVVSFYVRNEHLELSIPYEYFGIAYSYFPDFVVRLISGTTLLLEIKGEEREKDRAKHQAARRWVSAVNHWGQLGNWAFHVCKDPQQVIDEIRFLMLAQR
jgi:type III restriction enzyme